MTSMELIIRPFQRGVVTPPTRVREAESQKWENAVLLIGKGGSKTLSWNESGSSSQSFKTGDDHTEVSRVSTAKRITNPDDPSQHVDVCETTALTFKNDADKKKKMTLNFSKNPSCAPIG